MKFITNEQVKLISFIIMRGVDFTLLILDVPLMHNSRVLQIKAIQADIMRNHTSFRIYHVLPRYVYLL